MASGRDEEVRKRAHEIWEQEGRPHGKDAEHWDRAEREVMAATSGKKTAAPKKTAARAKSGAAKPAAPKKNGATKAASSRTRKAT